MHHIKLQVEHSLLAVVEASFAAYTLKTTWYNLHLTGARIPEFPFEIV